ncbi:MAG: PAS domain S-box protein, partial [Stellaceae bacterium]
SQLVAIALFLLVGAMIVALISLLNQAIDRLWAQTENINLILESEPAGVIAVDGEGRISLVNAAVERQLGYDREELIGRSVDMLVPFEHRPSHPAFRENFMAEPVLRPMGAGRDLNALAKDGSLVPVEIGLNPIRRKGVVGTLATIVDISERKNLEARAHILAREVGHRANNLLTLVQALARRTLPPEASAPFIGLLGALARTQEIFGSNTTAQLRAIIEGELATFRDQLELSGCEIFLAAHAAQDFALIVHELTTNALKYGALSTTDGRITVSGRVDEDGSFVFHWRERGGPRVPPAIEPGFGHTILRDVPGRFATVLTLDFEPEGLRYELRVPLAKIGNLADLSRIAESA